MQELLVLLVFIFSIGYLSFKGYQKIFSKKKDCNINCGCDSSSPLLKKIKNEK